jgi:hypothetical protein
MGDPFNISQRPFDSGDDLPPIAAGTLAPASGDSSLEGLRARLVVSRSQRGNCPDLIELQQDCLPSIEPRQGREERVRHFERCGVCNDQIHTWKNSWEGRAAFALALSRVVAHHISVRATKATGLFSRRKPVERPREIRAPRTMATETPVPPRAAALTPAPPRAATLPPPKAVALASAPPIAEPSRVPVPVQANRSSVLEQPRVEIKKPPAPVAPSKPKKPSAPLETLPPLLVLEAPPPGVVPKALLLAVAERGGAVVTLPNVEEVFGDPDFASVRALILARSRPLADWPGAIQRARDRAPGRLVLAVVPVPRFGPAAVTWGRDSSVLLPPVSEKDWGPALERGGWTARR